MSDSCVSVCLLSDLLEDLERCPHAAAIAECFVERVSAVPPSAATRKQPEPLNSQ